MALRREQTTYGPLVLVNAAHPLSAGPAPELVPPAGHRPGVLMEQQAAVSWLPCPGAGAELAVPEDACVQVSAYDGGGFIVTVREAVS